MVPDKKTGTRASKEQYILIRADESVVGEQESAELLELIHRIPEGKVVEVSLPIEEYFNFAKGMITVSRGIGRRIRTEYKNGSVFIQSIPYKEPDTSGIMQAMPRDTKGLEEFIRKQFESVPPEAEHAVSRKRNKSEGLRSLEGIKTAVSQQERPVRRLLVPEDILNKHLKLLKRRLASKDKEPDGTQHSRSRILPIDSRLELIKMLKIVDGGNEHEVTGERLRAIIVGKRIDKHKAVTALQELEKIVESQKITDEARVVILNVLYNIQQFFTVQPTRWDTSLQPVNLSTEEEYLKWKAVLSVLIRME